MRYRALPAVALLCTVLSACTTASINTGVAKIDASLQGNLPKTCAAASALHSGFIVYTFVASVSPQTRTREQRVWDDVVPLCVDPTRETSVSASFKAFALAQTLANIIREARAG